MTTIIKTDTKLGEGAEVEVGRSVIVPTLAGAGAELLAKSNN